jgi:hypothetical protein
MLSRSRSDAQRRAAGAATQVRPAGRDHADVAVGSSTVMHRAQFAGPRVALCEDLVRGGQLLANGALKTARRAHGD